ncbi:dharma [Synchiropus splendidus]|uniref:dharma n=1 Tax=Synchiropus splendidus TaxID=270530 RepID=UPI00237EC491|nr:dharma [Synchiropus splendidus]
MQSRKVSDFSIDSILASKPEPGHRELQTSPNLRHPEQDPSRGRAPQLLPPLGMRFEQFGYQQSGLAPNRVLASHPPAPCCLLSWNFATLLQAHSGNCGIREAGGSAQAQHCQRLRTVFTESQTRQLEALFHTDNYPTVEVRTRLAARIGLSVENVRVWFKNRRARRKRQVQRRAAHQHQ